MSISLYYLLYIDDCFDGDLQLVGGATESEGRVEICTGRRWATLCGKLWTENNTVVVCRHLGYSDIIDGRLSTIKALKTYYDCIFDVDSTYYLQKFDEGTGPIFADFVNCTGSEPRLWPDHYASGCPYFNHYYGCSHNDDVGVQCKPGIYLKKHVHSTQAKV